MKVIDGTFPWYLLQCDGHTFEVVFNIDFCLWRLLEDGKQGNWGTISNLIGASFQHLQDGISEAVADYEHNQQVLENRKLFEVIQ